MLKNEGKMNLYGIRIVQNVVFNIFISISVLQILHLHLEVAFHFYLVQWLILS